MKRWINIMTLLLTIMKLTTFSYAESTWERLNLDVTYLKSLEATPWGIIAGEMDTRTWSTPYNGVYFSTDLGQTWSAIGLQGRGIVDLVYFNNRIYAATYYIQDDQRGLFSTQDLGESWKHIGPHYLPTSIDINNECIYMGTKHYGLHISCDGGQTWEQKLSAETEIKKVAAFENIVLVSGVSNVYRSTDNGLTWQKIDYFNNKDFRTAAMIENILFIGNNSGLFRSIDNGLNWNKVADYQILKMDNFRNDLIISITNPLTFTTEVLLSHNLGDSWENLNINLHQQYKIIDLSKIFAKDFYFLALSLTKGIYKYEIQNNIENYPFLNPPWNLANTNNLIDKITAYFDHQYPLLGYSYHSEPDEENNTTLNYLGKKEKIPKIYYSSHSGTDFGLKYGTQILAPASGYARYYYCKDCGHSIKIDHLNGYETTYMHLQKEGILTLKSNDPIWVNAGDVLGKVGMTGKTTGAHLHFEVNSNNTFPDGRTDPFGWKSINKDPWKEYDWIDLLGSHNGSKSKNLWNHEISAIQSFDTTNVIHVLDNKTFEYSPIYGTTIKINPRGDPSSFIYNSHIKYIPNSAFYLDIYDQNNSPIDNNTRCTKITMDLENANISNVLLDTLSFYHYSKEEGSWEKIPSILNLASNFISAEVCEYSLYSVFGDKIDPEYPITSFESDPPYIEQWYRDYPVVYLLSTDSRAKIFYKLDYTHEWRIYESPIQINKDGISELSYRAEDEAENLEPTKTQIFKVNTSGKYTHKIRIKEAEFEITL